MTYNSPEVVHSAICDECGGTVRDGERQLYPHGKIMACWDCIKTLEAESDYESAEDETPVSDRWFFLAGDIALAPFNGRA